MRAERVPVDVPDGENYSTVVVRRWRARNPERARAQSRRSSRIQSRAASWVRRNRPDVWARISAEVDAETDRAT
jgi:hypothetical protein